MATSDHVNRIQKAEHGCNDQCCLREEGSCQFGAVHTWRTSAEMGYFSPIPNLLYDGNGEGGYGALMKSSVVKRSIVIDGHKTSVSLEDAFWTDQKKSRVPSKRRCRN